MSQPDDLQQALNWYRKLHIDRVLREENYDCRKTAARLGMALSTFYRIRAQVAGAKRPAGYTAETPKEPTKESYEQTETRPPQTEDGDAEERTAAGTPPSAQCPVVPGGEDANPVTDILPHV